MADSLKKRYERRKAAWRQRWRTDLNAPGARQLARFDMNVFDHGYLRRLNPNRAPVVPGIWRSSQPHPGLIRKLARQGLGTIINLRGRHSFGSYVLEAETAAELGITLIDLPMSSSTAPTVDSIRAFHQAITTAPRPILLHCKSGADRAGLASAMAVLIEGGTPAQAKAHLSLRYLHVRATKSGILDAFVDAYAAHGDLPFMDWVETVYDPQALEAAYRTGRGGTLLGSLMRRE